MAPGIGVLMTKFSVTECVRAPSVPVSVAVKVPGKVLVRVPIKNEVVLVVVVGLMVAVIPAGRPEMEKVALPVRPFIRVIVIVALAEAPVTMLKVPCDG